MCLFVNVVLFVPLVLMCPFLIQGSHIKMKVPTLHTNFCQSHRLAARMGEETRRDQGSVHCG